MKSQDHPAMSTQIQYKGVRDTKIRKQVIAKEKNEEEEEERLIGIQNFLFLLNTEIFLKKTQTFKYLNI